MSAARPPEGAQHRSAQHEGTPVSAAPARPKQARPEALGEGAPVSAGQPLQAAGAARDADGVVMRRRLAVVAAFATALPLRAAPVLPLAASLRDEIAAASRAGQPLVVMVSLEGCAYCRTVRDHYLGPMRTPEDLPVVQVDMRSSKPVLDAAGQPRTHDQLVRAWRIDAAPTLLFLGDGGRELAPRLRGMSSADFYGAYLGERIETARRALRP